MDERRARARGRPRWPVHRGVWRLREAPQTRNAALAAAVPAGGPLAVVAGRASARSHGLLLYEPEDIEVATPWQRGPADGIAWRERVHDAAPVLVAGVPCSGIPRVLLELGATGTRAELLVAIALYRCAGPDGICDPGACASAPVGETFGGAVQDGIAALP